MAVDAEGAAAAVDAAMLGAVSLELLLPPPNQLNGLSLAKTVPTTEAKAPPPPPVDICFPSSRTNSSKSHSPLLSASASFTIASIFSSLMSSFAARTTDSISLIDIVPL